MYQSERCSEVFNQPATHAYTVQSEIDYEKRSYSSHDCAHFQGCQRTPGSRQEDEFDAAKRDEQFGFGKRERTGSESETSEDDSSSFGMDSVFQRSVLAVLITCTS